jgi:pentatricopeptide repeat protein
MFVPLIPNTETHVAFGYKNWEEYIDPKFIKQQGKKEWKAKLGNSKRAAKCNCISTWRSHFIWRALTLFTFSASANGKRVYKLFPYFRKKTSGVALSPTPSPCRDALSPPPWPPPHHPLPTLRPFSTAASYPPLRTVSSSDAARCTGAPDPATLAPDDAIAALLLLADSAAALALFRRLAARPDLRRLMRLCATAATTFVSRGEHPMAHEAMRTMVAAFAEAGRLREAADMVLEMQSHGLPLRRVGRDG